jgi:L-seryl-tRNA(Ser) seleniumtransferase
MASGRRRRDVRQRLPGKTAVAADDPLMASLYRSLPSVDRLLKRPELQALGSLPASVCTALAREAIAEAREALAHGRRCPTIAQLAAEVVVAGQALLRPSLRPVINATGVIIHTNLGRAPLSSAAIAAMEAVTSGYSNLELDLESGNRGSRHTHLEDLLWRVTGAEAGIAVNNNASALLLGLIAVATGREVVISRSQAVEIGGGFRIPDVMRQSGASLIEVGTTNRTYLRDFEQAIGEQTAALLRVHSSNFRITGFTTFPELSELVELAHRHGVLVLDDLGSGCLIPVTSFGLASEPLVQDSIGAGVDLAFFSGDKLLGGPQAGIIVGRESLIQRLRSHPLARAVRMDKASIAGLSATLMHYLRGEALEQIPVWRMIATPLDGLEPRTSAWAATLGEEQADTRSGRSMIGGGSLPEESLPTCLLALRSAAPSALARRLRNGQPSVVARIDENTVLLDPRTVDPSQDAELLRAVRQALGAERPEH